MIMNYEIASGIIINVMKYLLILVPQVSFSYFEANIFSDHVLNIREQIRIPVAYHS